MAVVYKRECTPTEWQEFIKVMQSGTRFEVDGKMWYYWLEVLPPVFMSRHIDYFPGREGLQTPVDFGFAEGTELITVFWRESGHYYGQRTNKRNRTS